MSDALFRPAHREAPVQLSGNPGQLKSAQPETDGGGEIEAIRQSVLDLCKGHPHAKIEWPHRELHAIADRLAALATPEGQTEGAVDRDGLRSIIYTATHHVLPFAEVQMKPFSIQERAGMQVEIADLILAALASKGV